MNEYKQFLDEINGKNINFLIGSGASNGLIPTLWLPLFEKSFEELLGVHNRWASILVNLSESDLNRTMQHPDNGIVPLKQMLSLYAWHGKDHLEHIKIALS